MSENNSSSSADVTTLSLKPGDKIDAYTVTETIASTGSAVVYKAHDDLLDRFVAIKQIILGNGDTDEALRKRIRDEASIHKRVSTAQPKHLIQFIDAVDDERGLMLVSEYYPSTSLEDLLHKVDAPLEERQALGIVAATAKGLEAIHEAGVVHRDLKPSNILLGSDGGLKICDFGLAALIESQDSLSLGSVRYMAPELLRAEPADGRADIYSLGMIAYEMLIGRPNFDTAFRNVLRDQRNQAMRWMKWHTNPRATAPLIDDYLEEVPPHLTQLVARMMDKDQARRVGSAEDVVDAIKRHFVDDRSEKTQAKPAANESPSATEDNPSSSEPGDTAPLPTRSKLPLILGGLLAFWIVVGAVLFFVNESKNAAAQRAFVAEGQSLVQQGNNQYDEGEFNASIASYQSVLDGWPQDSKMYKQAQLGLWKTQGRVAFNDQQYLQAIELFEKYRDQGGEAASVESLILEARDAEAFVQLTTSVNEKIQAEAYREAQLIIKDARENKWTDEQTQQLDALDQLVEQRRAEALAAQVIAEAEALVKDGDLPGAIAKLEELASLPPTGQRLLEKLRTDVAFDAAIADGEAKLASGLIGEAIDAFKVASNINPSDELATRIDRLEARRLTQEGAVLFESGEYDAANERFVRALEKDPNNLDAQRLIKQISSTTEFASIEARGDAAAAADDLDGAIAAYEEAVEMVPDSVSVRIKLDNTRVRRNLQLARTAINDNDFDRAQGLLEAAQLIAPQDAAVIALFASLDTQREYSKLVALGDAARKAKDFGKAKRLYRDAEKLVKSEEIANRIDDAEFEQAIALTEQYLKDGEYEAAQATLNQASSIRPTSPQLVTLSEAIEKATSGSGTSEDGG